MTVNWNEILASKPEEAKAPEPLPVGTYLAIITGREFGESRNKQTPYVRYKVRLVSPLEDVDQQAFTTFGGGEKLAKRVLDYDFYMTEDSRYRHTEFLQNVLKINVTGRGWSEVLEDTNNKQLKVHVAAQIEQTPPNPPPNWKPRIFARIDDSAAVE